MKRSLSSVRAAGSAGHPRPDAERLRHLRVERRARDLHDVLQQVFVKFGDELVEDIQVGNLQRLGNDVEHLARFAVQQDLQLDATRLGEPGDNRKRSVLGAVTVIDCRRNHPDHGTDAREPLGQVFQRPT